MRDRTIVMSGFSKTFSVTGWRLGYATADAKWMAAMSYFHDLTYVCAPSALQHGAAAGLEQLPAELLYQDRRRSPVQARTDARRSARRRFRAERSGRSLLRPGQLPPVSPATPLRKRRAICSPPPAWPPLREAPSSVPIAAKTCSGSALPSRIMTWTKPALVSAVCRPSSFPDKCPVPHLCDFPGSPATGLRCWGGPSQRWETTNATSKYGCIFLSDFEGT